MASILQFSVDIDAVHVTKLADCVMNFKIQKPLIFYNCNDVVDLEYRSDMVKNANHLFLL